MADASLMFVLDAQLPFVRHPDTPGCLEESYLFNAISDTYLPLLRSCTALETSGVPFSLAIAFSPTLCEMLSDPLLRARYVDSLDRSIEFGLGELDRCSSSPETRELIKNHLDHLQINRRDYVENAISSRSSTISRRAGISRSSRRRRPRVSFRCIPTSRRR